MEWIRCYVACEGYTEVDFIRQSLAPYFEALQIELIPLCIQTSKGYKGGALTYDRVENFIKKKLKEDKRAFLTTMFDYYALDKKFSQNIAANANIYEGITQIQDTFNEHIKQECKSEKFFLYIQPHEFESLLFSDITKIIQADAEWQENSLEKLQEIIREYENPEFINNSRETSPSHRLQKIFTTPKYNKVVHGSTIAQNIGIDNIRRKCQHFNSWCEKIQNLNKIN